MKSGHGKKKKTKRKSYQKPTATQLTPEEVKAKLRPLAEQGNKQAQEMLRIISREPPQPKREEKDDLDDKKKSA